MKSMWDQIVEGKCPWDDEDTSCPVDCKKGEDYCAEFRRVREVGHRKEEFLIRLKEEIQKIILLGESPMYGGKCPSECYRTNDKRYSESGKRCDEYKYTHGEITSPKHWSDVGK